MKTALKTGSHAVPIGLLVAVVLGGCLRQVDRQELPTGTGNPESPAPAPSLSPISPVPLGPGPAPTDPGPTGTPAPDATPTPPSASGCRLPRGSGSGEDCQRTSPAFLGDVQGAIKQLIQDQPSLFTKGSCTDCYDVTDTGAFLSGVIGQMSRRGFCAMYDGEELAVKNTNDFNEQYDILSSSGGVRSGSESYRSTCRPAWF
jgi:hypothetical protein